MASSNNEAKIKFTAETADFTQAVKDANSEISSLKAEMKLADATFKNTGDAAEYQKEKMDLLQQALEANHEKQEALSAKLEAAKALYGEDSAEVNELKTSLTYAQIQEQNLLSQVNDTNDGLGQQEQAAESAGSSVDSMAEILINAGVAAKIKEIADNAMEMAQQFDEAKAAIVEGTGASGEGLQGLQEAAEGAFGRIKDSDQDITSVSSVLAELNTRFGVTGKDAEDLTVKVADFAKATGSDGGKAVDSLADVMHRWGLEMDDVDGLMDDLTTANQSCQLSVDDLTGYLTTNSTQFQELGYSTDEALAMLIGLSDGGANVGTVMSGLTKAIANLSGETDDVPGAFQAAIKAIEESGSVSEALQKEVGDTGKTVEEVFGKKAAQELATNIQNGSFAIEDWTKVLEDNDGAMQSTAEGVTTMGDSWSQATNNFTMAVGKTFTPVISDAVKKVSEVITAVSQVIQKSPEAQAAIVAVATAIGILGAALGISAAIAAVQKAFALLNTTMLANPVFLVVTAIAALAAGLVYAYKHSKKFREIVDKTFKAIKKTVIPTVKKFAQDVVKAFKDILTKVTKFMKQIKDGIILVWNNIKKTVSTVLNTIKSTVSNAWNAIKTTTQKVWNTIKTTVSNIWNTIKTTISNVLKAIRTAVTNGWNAIKTTISNALKTIRTTISSVWNAIKTTVSNVLKSIRTTVSNAWNTIKTTISNVLNSIKTTITTAWNGIKTTVSNALKSIKTTVSNAWNGIKTTISNVLNGIKTTISNVWSGIKTTVSNTLKSIKTTVTNVWKSIKTTISNVLKSIKTTVSSVWKNIKTTISNVLNGIKTTISSGFNTVKSKVSSVWNGIKTTISNAIKNAKTTVSDTVASIKDKVGNTFDAVKDKVSTVWENVKSSITKPIDSAKSTVSSVVDSIKSTVSGAFDTVKSNAKSAWNGVKDAITGPINSAKKTVSGVVDKIKDLFPVNLGKICKIKLPHISVSAGSPPWGIGGQGQKPSFSVTWNAKGKIFKRPAILDSIYGLQGVGEAGPEAVAPIDVLQGYVKDAVEAAAGTPIDYDKLASKVAAACARMDIRMDIDGRSLGRIVREMV